MKQRVTQSSLFLLTLLSLGHFTVDMHTGSLPTLFPEIRNAYGISYTQVGLLMLISQITSSVIQPLFGLISDRVPTRWLLPTSLLVATGGLLIIGEAQTYAAVMAGVIIMGIGIASYHPEASKLSYLVSDEQKGRAMSIFALGGNIGVSFGPALMGVGLSLFGMRGTLLFVPVTLITVVLIMRSLTTLYAGQSRWSGDPADGDAKKARAVGKKEWKSIGLLLVIIFLRSGAHASLMTFIPMYYTDHLGLSAGYTSFLLTVFLLAGAFGTFLGGPASDRFSPRRVIILSLVLATPFIGLLPLTSGGVAPFVLMAIIGCSLISSFAVTTVMGQTLLANNVGLASGLTLGFSVGTGGVTATFLGMMADQWSLNVALAAIACITLTGGLLAFKLPHVRTGRAKEPTAEPVQAAS